MLWRKDRQNRKEERAKDLAMEIQMSHAGSYKPKESFIHQHLFFFKDLIN